MENGKIKVWLPAIKAGSGADVYTRRLAAALERNGMATQISWFPLSHELLPFLLRNEQPPAGTDIIIANSWNGFAFKRPGLPLVVVVHHCVFDSDLRRFKSPFQYLYHRFLAEPREVRSLHAADAVVAVSRYVANHLRQKPGLDRVEVIHNWVDADLFKPQPMAARKSRPFRLLFVGRLTRLKGGDLLAPLMRRLGADFHLSFTAVPQEVKSTDLPANMIPIGRLSESEMVRAYQSCDALLLSSRAEGFGYSALEAMACAKPVIAGNNSALPEIVSDGVTGILCDTGNIESFAKAIRELADVPETGSVMGNAGRQRAINQLSESSALALYRSLIEKLVKRQV